VHPNLQYPLMTMARDRSVTGATAQPKNLATSLIPY